MVWKSALCIVALSALLCGCGSSTANNAGNNTPPGKTDSDESVAQAPTGEGKLSGDLTVLAFKGGYGLDFYQTAGTEFQTKNPGLSVKVDGSADVDKQVRTNMLAGTPPDLMYPGWRYDHWTAAD